MGTKRRWHGITPGMGFTVTLYAESKEGAKGELRKHLGVSRLPKGSTVWVADEVVSRQHRSGYSHHMLG